MPEFRKIQLIGEDSGGMDRIISIKPSGMEGIRLSSNQMIPSVKREDVTPNERYSEDIPLIPDTWAWDAYSESDKMANWTPKGYKVSELKVGDYIAIRNKDEVVDTSKIDITEFIEFDGYDWKENVYGDVKKYVLEKHKDRWQSLPEGFVRYKNSRKPIPKEIELNKPFLRLVGYYLAEGSYEDHGITLTFNKNEKEYIEEVKETISDVFSLEARTNSRENRDVTDVCVDSLPLKRLFKRLCGSGATNKRLHWMLMALPPEKQEHILDTYHNGDGHIRKDMKRKVYNTSSRDLAYQVWFILNRLRKKPSISYIKCKTNYTTEERERWKVYHSLYPEEKQTHDKFYHNGYLYIPIRKIIKGDVNG